jgi:hypothetical protein
VPTGNAHIDARNWTGVHRIIAPNDEAYPMWLHLNKCGTTTMAELLGKIPGGVNAFFHHDYPVEREVVCMWRNPFDRIEATYRMYTQKDVHGWGGKSFEYFITHICTDKRLRDPHMLPMYEVATNKYGRFVPDRVLLWDWDAVEEIYGLKPEIRNHTPGRRQNWPRELRVEFEKRFELDLMVWHTVK